VNPWTLQTNPKVYAAADASRARECQRGDGHMAKGRGGIDRQLTGQDRFRQLCRG